jgi:small subunit ribosomal protein S6
MPLYECVFIARSELAPQQVEALADHVAAQLAEGGGSVKKREYWGLRNLAYRIKKNRKGHYFLLGIDAPAPAIHEMERQLRLNEDVLRFLTVRVEEIEEGPSAILYRRTDERDRGDRGGRGPGRGAGRFESGRRRFEEREEFQARGAAEPAEDEAIAEE